MFKHSEMNYLESLKEVLNKGELKKNRTSSDVYSLLGMQLRYDFSEGFPLFTTKKMYFSGIVHELLWFLSGSTNIEYLVKNNVNIWNDDAYNFFRKRNPKSKIEKEEFVKRIKENKEYGYVGPIYGKQWRDFKASFFTGGIDQIENVINSIQKDPFSRRHIVTAWNPRDLKDSALPPCHVLFQFNVTTDRKLWCHLYQRSADMFLGVPFNVASYSLLTYIIAHLTDLEPGGFIHTINDAHVYEDHVDAVSEQLNRVPYPYPFLKINKDLVDIDDLAYTDIQLVNYKFHQSIKAPLITS